MTKNIPIQQQDKNASSASDDALSSHYQHRKAQHPSPASVRKNVINNLVNATYAKKPWWRVNVSSYLQISAVCFTVALTFVVISMQTLNRSQSFPQTQYLALQDYVSVEIHEVVTSAESLASTKSAQTQYEESLSANSLSSLANTEQRQVQYKQAQSIYLAKQSNLRVHQQSYAMVVQSDNGLSLLTCDKHLLKLSQQVVDVLFNGLAEANIDFSKGSMLALDFDSNGHIIDITQEKSITQC